MTLLTPAWGNPAYTKIIGNDIAVTFREIAKRDNHVYALYSVFSKKDFHIAVDGYASPLFDSAGMRLAYNGEAIYIGGNATNKRDVAADVPTHVMIYYSVDAPYTVTQTYPRITLAVNGEKVTFRDVSAKP